MLLVASVVVPHPLWIADHGCVVARDLQVLREGMRPFRRGHHASGPLAVERNQQERRLSYRSLGLNERLNAATTTRELRQVRGDGVVDGATLRGIAAAFLDPARCSPEPTHAPIMAAMFHNRGPSATERMAPWPVLSMALLAQPTLGAQLNSISSCWVPVAGAMHVRCARLNWA